MEQHHWNLWIALITELLPWRASVSLLLLGCLIVQAQELPTFRAEVSQIHVDAEVLSADGHVVTGLGASDFRILDEGMAEPIVALRTDQEALDLILLIDVTGSMNRSARKLWSASREALAELKQGDRVAVMTFTTSAKLVVPLTENLDVIENAVQEITTGKLRGNTFIHQAIDDAARYLFRERRTGRRRAVLIITDNQGWRTVSDDRVADDLLEADAVLMGLVIIPRRLQRREAKIIAALVGVRGMDQIAAKTGGDTIHADENEDAFSKAMYRLRNRYSLYYATPKGTPGTYRTIRVELTFEAQRLFPGARVYTRRGYRYE